tara:strand:- start:50 stop:820 length:771 start_codon:yes stop_codon:yes gene_type:complete
MKTIILAGGYGTRISEYTDKIPKPMVPIGENPIIWHIMKCYSKFNYNNFIIALGYKSSIIKEYFLNYHSVNSNFSINLSSGEINYSKRSNENWLLDFYDTGLNTSTGGRLKKLKNIIGNNTFMLTYGDGLSDININELIKFHKKNKKIATVTAVRPTARFGEMQIDTNGEVLSFEEKKQINTGWINGGFFVFEPEIFDFIENDDTMLEKEPLMSLVNNNQLIAYKHEGFWQCMDTKREYEYLNDLWHTGNAPWLKK